MSEDTEDLKATLEEAKRRREQLGLQDGPPSESFQGLVSRMAEKYGPASVPENPTEHQCRTCQTMIPYGCGVCNECGSKDAEARRQRHILATIPRSFHWSAFGSPDLLARVRNRAAVALAQESLSVDRVVLMGRAGDGKTSLLVAMLRAWDERREYGELAHFVASWRLGRSRLRHGLGEGEPDEVRYALRAPLLALDDLGSEGRVPNGSATFDVICDRHEGSRPTWVTTAMSVTDMRELYGDGFTRRIFEHARIIDCAPQGP